VFALGPVDRSSGAPCSSEHVQFSDGTCELKIVHLERLYSMASCSLKETAAFSIRSATTDAALRSTCDDGPAGTRPRVTEEGRRSPNTRPGIYGTQHGLCAHLFEVSSCSRTRAGRRRRAASEARVPGPGRTVSSLSLIPCSTPYSFCSQSDTDNTTTDARRRGHTRWTERSFTAQ
jgi:hypothetical protein